MICCRGVLLFGGVECLSGIAVDFSVSPFKDCHEFLVLCQTAPIGCPRHPHRCRRFVGFFQLVQAAGQVHVLFHLVPLDGKAGSVGTENGIRRVFQIAVAVIPHCGNDFFRILTGSIALGGTDQSAHAVGITGHL